MKRPTLLILIAALAVAGIYLFMSSGSSPSDIASDTDVVQEDETTSPDDVTLEPNSLSEEDEVRYELDTDASVLGWHAERIVGNSHEGTVPISSGSMRLERGVATEGGFVVDMTGITESNDTQMFLKHIASDDFFSVADHPTAAFSITRAVPTSGDGNVVNYDVTGDLTIRGITNEVTFPANAVIVDEETLDVTANFQIDRTRWEINYDSGSIFLQLGDKAIRDEITFDLDLTFRTYGETASEEDAS